MYVCAYVCTFTFLNSTTCISFFFFTQLVFLTADYNKKIFQHPLISSIKSSNSLKWWDQRNLLGQLGPEILQVSPSTDVVHMGDRTSKCDHLQSCSIRPPGTKGLQQQEVGCDWLEVRPVKGQKQLMELEMPQLCITNFRKEGSIGKLQETIYIHCRRECRLSICHPRKAEASFHNAVELTSFPLLSPG